MFEIAGHIFASCTRARKSNLSDKAGIPKTKNDECKTGELDKRTSRTMLRATLVGDHTKVVCGMLTDRSLVNFDATHTQFCILSDYL